MSTLTAVELEITNGIEQYLNAINSGKIKNIKGFIPLMKQYRAPKFNGDIIEKIASFLEFKNIINFIIIDKDTYINSKFLWVNQHNFLFRNSKLTLVKNIQVNMALNLFYYMEFSLCDRYWHAIIKLELCIYNIRKRNEHIERIKDISSNNTLLQEYRFNKKQIRDNHEEIRSAYNILHDKQKHIIDLFSVTKYKDYLLLKEPVQCELYGKYPVLCKCVQKKENDLCDAFVRMSLSLRDDKKEKSGTHLDILKEYSDINSATPCDITYCYYSNKVESLDKIYLWNKYRTEILIKYNDKFTSTSYEAFCILLESDYERCLSYDSYVEEDESEDDDLVIFIENEPEDDDLVIFTEYDSDNVQ